MDTNPSTSSRSEYFRRRRKERNPEQRESENEARRQRKRRQMDSNPDFRAHEIVRKRKTPPPSKYAARDMQNQPREHYLGLKTTECSKCSALHFEKEKNYRGKFSLCCGDGSIKLTQTREYPDLFKDWLIEANIEGKHFRTNIRKYNSAFAFASFGYQPVKFPAGPQTFVIHGQVYHRTAASLNQQKPMYAQLYILDPEFANNERATNDHNLGCKIEFFERIEEILRTINPFAGAYRMMKEMVERDPGAKIQMWITKDRQHDPRRYNLPVVNEVAAVFVSKDGEPPFDRDISVHPIGGSGLQNISIISPNCDPMTYPLLFPNGEPGWQPGIAKDVSAGNVNNEEEQGEKNKNVSMLEFYSYHLQERQIFNPLLHAGKLTQQFIVDAFLKVEGQRLQWNQKNQKQLRVDLYMGLMDYVHSQAENRDLKAGRIVILPSSFTGGKRCMQQNYQDAMVLVANFGKPDLFITFTCNPKWKEITEQLQTYETAMDRPDIIATVFNLKLKEFMNDMVNDKGGVLGKVKAYLSVIEFQKRGTKLM